MAYFALLCHQALALGRFLGKDVSLEGLLKRDLAGAGYLEPLLGTRICFNLWHLMMRFFSETLLAVLHLQHSFGAIWAIRSRHGVRYPP